jgi:hypothetical protein
MSVLATEVLVELLFPSISEENVIVIKRFKQFIFEFTVPNQILEFIFHIVIKFSGPNNVFTSLGPEDCIKNSGH